MSLKTVIIGGHGKVALRLGRLLAGAGHSVVSLIRDESQSADILETGATPLTISLEESDPSDLAKVFNGVDVVYFSAGAGGKGGAERTKKVDYEGALKVFDAIEKVEENPPKLILVSGVDVRDPDRIPHTTEQDKEVSKRIRARIPDWMHWKYEADKNLAARTKFNWFILRPGGLADSPGTGKADIGITHISQLIPRDDVAQALFLLANRKDIYGLSLDIVGGDTPIQEGLDAAIAKRVKALDVSV
ncbi:NADH(P)-binding-domain-containing protein [Cantharellus anzutake]|uniref:NADH(P)-binding-domain-containing protein n=1 Tax=Cantharellus anzutake TaxID=1750568 RepID=UPI001907FBDF|nr:NADH(P)-binding-domain-containing protein [Cantharellus anzutake]KAF8332414.1 NADH(P)-binding-domain-containing protein [Cantharellus anzutake]